VTRAAAYLAAIGALVCWLLTRDVETTLLLLAFAALCALLVIMRAVAGPSWIAQQWNEQLQQQSETLFDSEAQS
jgi:hypothetical protein